MAGKGVHETERNRKKEDGETYCRHHWNVLLLLPLNTIYCGIYSSFLWGCYCYCFLLKETTIERAMAAMVVRGWWTYNSAGPVVVVVVVVVR